MDLEGIKWSLAIFEDHGVDVEGLATDRASSKLY